MTPSTEVTEEWVLAGKTLYRVDIRTRPPDRRLGLLLSLGPPHQPGRLQAARPST